MIFIENKVVILAGGNGLIGRQIFKALNDADCTIVLIDKGELHPEIQEIASKNYKVKTYQTDVSDTSKLRKIFNEIHVEFGSIDGAVNAVYPKGKNFGRNFFDVKVSDFLTNISVHLGAYFSFMQQCVHYSLKHDQNFSLVNLSSIYGSYVPRFDIYKDVGFTMPVEYADIKAATEHLSRYINAYVKERDSSFRSNCVSPGGVLDSQLPSFTSKYNKYCRDKGLLEAEDICGAVLFLLSDHSNFVVGQNIVVDDGFTQ